jgi:hypothetical protein
MILRHLNQLPAWFKARLHPVVHGEAMNIDLKGGHICEYVRTLAGEIRPW